MTKRLLIVFVKNPELGKCKTRLAKTVGEEKALNFYKNMLFRTSALLEDVRADRAIYYSNKIDKNDFFAPDSNYIKAIQYQSDDLGDRMLKAIQDGFNMKYESVCIIGTDSYELSASIINKAFSILEESDAVIGPSNDGGYYLLGFSKLLTEAFKQKKWSTETVFKDTVDDFRQHDLKYEVLPELVDVDTFDDLQTLGEEKVENLLNF